MPISVQIVLIAPLWPQQTWFSEVLQLLVSAPVHLPLFPNKRKVSASKSASTQPSRLGVIKQSVRDRNFAIVAIFVSKSRRTSTQKAYDAKWIVYTHWCHRRTVNPVMAPLTVIGDFIFYLFL